MNETIKVLTTRRSVRKYLPRQVDTQTLDQILEAGLYAPSAMGRQPVVMVAIQDKATRDEISRLNAAVMGGSGDPFYGAPTIVVVLVDLEVGLLPVQDGSLAMGNLLNAAHALGLDSCWINRAEEVFETEEGKALLSKWGLKGRYQGIGNCALGYVDGEYPAPKARREGTIVRV